MTIKAKFVLSFYTFGLVHHVYTWYHSQFLIDYSKTTDIKIHDIKKYNNRFLTSWNMGLQTLYFLIALIFEILLINRNNISRSVIDKASKVRGYLFSTLVFPSTTVVAFFFWLFYHINSEYVIPNGVDDVFPKWINHSIHTNIIFLPIIELCLQRMWVPSMKSAFIGITLYSHIYNAFYLFTYFNTGKWLYPLYELINWPQRIALLGFMYAFGASACMLGIFIQNMKSKNCDITKATYKKRVANVTKKLL